MGKNKTEEQTVTIKYKIQMLVEIEGTIEGNHRLRDDTGIEPFIQWASEDIEKALDGTCEIVGVKKVMLEEV